MIVAVTIVQVSHAKWYYRAQGSQTTWLQTRVLDRARALARNRSSTMDRSDSLHLLELDATLRVASADAYSNVDDAAPPRLRRAYSEGRCERVNTATQHGDTH